MTRSRWFAVTLLVLAVACQPAKPPSAADGPSCAEADSVKDPLADATCTRDDECEAFTGTGCEICPSCPTAPPRAVSRRGAELSRRSCACAREKQGDAIEQARARVSCSPCARDVEPDPGTTWSAVCTSGRCGVRKSGG